MAEQIEFISAVLLVSSDAPALAAFYRDVIGIPLVEERHGDTELHYGCELGEVHFAIHPKENFAPGERKAGNINLAFAVFDIAAVVQRVEANGGALLYPPEDSGFAIMTALVDPDGNHVEITQLSDKWYAHLEKKQAASGGIVARWRASKKP